MNILSIENLSKTVNDEPLFEAVSLGLEEGEKAGIVGRNGAGKSTFLQCIIGETVPDEGTVSMKKDINPVMLSQQVAYPAGTTVSSFLYLAGGEKLKVLEDYQRAIESGNEKEYMRLSEIIEKNDLWDIERSYKAVLTDLGGSFDDDILMESLSGGEQKKAAIARALTMKPGLLLLDEPTNHLDIRTIEYLENWIKSTSSGVIIVTHDRHILNDCCSSIWELDRKHFYRHPGSFSAYLERKEERLRMDEKEQERLKTILRRELEWLKRGPKARTGKDKNRKDRIQEMLGKEHKVREDAPRDFSTAERRLGKKILEVEKISKEYDGKKLFSDFSISFTKGMKLGLIGDNGSGKSTLLDIISGRIEPDSGSIDRGVNTHFGYYDQLGRNLSSSKTILEYTEDIGDRISLGNGTIVSASRFLELFGFPVSMQRTPVERLSGGERRRLYLITRLASNPNFLLFDEPTNDLDISTMEKLEEYIASFPGCAIISSHDRTFLDMTTDMTLVIENGMISLFPGTFTEWKESKEEQADDKPEEKVQKDTRAPREKKGLTYREKKEKETIETEISALEMEIKELEESFSIPGTTPLGTLEERSKRYEAAKAELDAKSDRWLELEEKADS